MEESRNQINSSTKKERIRKPSSNNEFPFTISLVFMGVPNKEDEKKKISMAVQSAPKKRFFKVFVFVWKSSEENK